MSREQADHFLDLIESEGMTYLERVPYSQVGFWTIRVRAQGQIEEKHVKVGRPVVLDSIITF